MSQERHRAETIAERRKYERYPLKLKVDYVTEPTEADRSTTTQSISRDLGIGGIALLVGEKLETGQTLEINIALPSISDLFSGDEDNLALSAAEQNVTLLSRVVWRQPYDDAHYLIGVQFLDLEHKDAIALKEFLEEYKLQDGTVDQED